MGHLIKLLSVRALLMAMIFCVPTFASANLKKSYKLEAAGKYRAALSNLEKMAKKDVGNYFYQLRTGWLAYLSGQMSKSQKYYQKAILLAPRAIEPRIGQLLPLIALGKYKQAQSVAKAILRRDTKNYTARSRMAYALFLSGQYKQAQRFYSSLVKDYPADGNMLIGLGWAQLRRGKRKAALVTFEKARAILPGNKKVAEGIKYSNKKK